MPTVAETKQNIRDTIERILKRDGEFDVEVVACNLGLESGYKKQTIMDIIQMMVGGKRIIIDKYGIAKLRQLVQVKDESQNDNTI